MDDRSSLTEGRVYLLKHSTRTVRATAQTMQYRLDVNGLHRDEAAAELKLNEIGRVSFHCTEPFWSTTTDQPRRPGASSSSTRRPTQVGAGVIRAMATTHASPNVVRHGGS